MHAIDDRFNDRCRDRFTAHTSFDADTRPGELSSAIARAQDGDERAIQYLYLRFAGNVYGYSRSIVADTHEAEDVTQQVFTRLITAIASYEPRAVPFSAWLLRITHNMSIDHLRRQRATPSDMEWLGSTGTDTCSERSMEIAAAISTLPEAQREVVVLRHILGWSPPEIAARMGRSEEAVHGLHHRGRRSLREDLTARHLAPMTMAA